MRDLLDTKTVYYVPGVISKNVARDSKGMLVCRDVQIARDGEFTYLGSEVYGNEHPLRDEKITVVRDEKEIFSKKTLASIETAVVTDSHPAEKRVTSTNSKYLQRGWVRNARVADYKDENGNKLLLADLIISDETMIQEIENGRKQVSIGYRHNQKMIDDDPKKLYSTDLIINHVAIVSLGKNGRAGSAFIVDEKKENDNIKELDLIPNISLGGGEVMADENKKFKFKHDGEVIEIETNVLTDQEAEKLATEIFKDRKKEKEENSDVQ